MEHLVTAVRSAVDQSNWYAALGLALTLPDICGRLEAPGKGSRARYVAWCNEYLVPRYTAHLGPQGTKHVFLHGEDCYALRCAVLHEGADEIVTQSARKALDSFRFVAPLDESRVHCNQFNSRLQLQVGLFCEDICASVEEWMRIQLPNDPALVERIKRLMKVETYKKGLNF